MKTNIKERRESLGLSKYKLAEIVGVHRSTIGRIEEGTHFPNKETLQKFASVFGVATSELIVIENDDL